MATRITVGSFASGQQQTRIEPNESEVFFREMIADLMDELGFDEEQAERQFSLLMSLRREAKARAQMFRKLPR